VDGRLNRRNKAVFSNFSGIAGVDGALSDFNRDLRAKL